MANTGKRARNRVARHSQLISAARAIVAEGGLDGLTMGDVAKRVDCAVGTIYTYFPSKSALLAALQSDAIRVLAASYESAAGQWDDAIDGMDLEETTAALTRVVALGRLFLNWQHIQPMESDFLHMLALARDDLIEPADGATVLPQVLTLFAEGRVLLDRAVELGAIGQDLDRPGDDGTSRTVRWITSLEGAVLVDRITAGGTGDLDPGAFKQETMAQTITHDYLLAWGAHPGTLAAAFAAAETMASDGTLLPEPIG